VKHCSAGIAMAKPQCPVLIVSFTLIVLIFNPIPRVSLASSPMRGATMMGLLRTMQMCSPCGY